ncbi:MAG TPA: ribonuclease HII [Candidatus Nitrosopolaris sp.]|nr:ribonuclease HII [Candidatus Nitrosopolaris sp.]
MQRTAEDVLIGGVDEAGRGSVIGPLVVAGISIEKNCVSRLRKLGIKDSKMLTPIVRKNFFGNILELANSLCISKFDSYEVDSYVFLNGLNELEAIGMAKVINNIHADRIYVDACDINLERYRNSIKKYLWNPKPRIHCLHHGDCINVAVSAASIVAKIIRDYEIQRIRDIYHDIGSGYPSDKKTMFFIKKWVTQYKSAPHFARKSWRPLRSMLESENASAY